eukprot:4312723-Lingulodinium_polyedra.AAC.1
MRWPTGPPRAGEPGALSRLQPEAGVAETAGAPSRPERQLSLANAERTHSRPAREMARNCRAMAASMAPIKNSARPE